MNALLDRFGADGAFLYFGLVAFFDDFDDDMRLVAGCCSCFGISRVV
jgi:hypothetical protein